MQALYDLDNTSLIDTDQPHFHCTPHHRREPTGRHRRRRIQRDRSGCPLAFLTYYLVSGTIGTATDSLFTLVQRNAQDRDHFRLRNQRLNYSVVRVQAKDEFNASVEGNFTVTLTDVHESSQPNHFVDLNSTVNLEMIWVEPGTFTMGSPTNESGRSSNEIEHSVTFNKGFYLGKYEVTQAPIRSCNDGQWQWLEFFS